MLHGMVSDTKGLNLIKINDLKDKNIDYLALGHVHSYKEYRIDSRMVACYSGCLEGRGFDEIGAKGFIVLDVLDKIKYEFVPFCFRTIHEIEIDISGAQAVNDVTKKINQEVEFNKNDIYKLVLKGEVSPELDVTEKDIESYYSDVYFIKVVIDTTMLINFGDFKNDISIKGEFVRTVLNNQKLSDIEKKEIISLGLKTLKGGVKESYENN